MSKRGKYNQGGYSRDSLRRNTDPRIESYFVPSFAIRRRAEQDEQLVSFLKGIRSILGSNYRVHEPSSISMTVVEQAKMVERLREAGERPEPTKVESLAHDIADSLESNLKGTPSSINVPIGIVDVFGGRENKLGFIPRGWKGYNARYAREDFDGNKLPLGMIVDENRLAVGGIATAFAHNKRLVMDGITRTPHATFATKYRGKIQRSEFRDISSEISWFIEEDMQTSELAFSDPVIYPKYEVGHTPEPIYIRV